MVIACPNCKRNYQIDTTRIPVGGTSFTCWSCRATVRVDPLGNTDAMAQPSSMPTRPAVPDADPNVPPSAMRFFESLAAEATLTRQMASESGVAPAIASEPPKRVTGSIPRDALERLQGDDVLDLPPIEPVEGARLPVDDVIDIGFPATAETTSSITDFAATTPDPGPGASKTVAFGSLSADSAEIAQTASTSGGQSTFRPVPPPISLPQSISVTQPMSALDFPALETEASVARRQEPLDEQELLPTAPFERPAGLERDEQTAAPDPVEPPTLRGSENRMTPSEMAVDQQRAWVAPEVQEPEARSRFGLLAIVAVLVVAVCLGLAWQFVLKDLIVGRMSTQPAAPASQAAPVASAPGDSAPSAPASPATAPSTAPTATPGASTPGPAANDPMPPVSSKPAADSGGFTIQVRSSPNEADAKQFADSLKSAGFDAYVMRADLGGKGVWFRVRVGRFQSREEAQREMGKLRSHAGTAIIQPFTES